MRYLLSFALALVLATTAYAEFKGPEGGKAGGFKGPGMMTPKAETVAAAKELPDNSWVVLTGNIISQIPGSKDDYVFKDGTGEINVEISRKRFQGQDVTPETKVRISGKVDKDLMDPLEIDVKKLEVLK